MTRLLHSLNPLPPQNNPRGFEKDEEIKNKRTMLEIVQIVLQLLEVVMIALIWLEKLDLRPTGEPWFGEVAKRVVGLFGEKGFDKFRPLRARADQ